MSRRIFSQFVQDWIEIPEPRHRLDWLLPAILLIAAVAVVAFQQHPGWGSRPAEPPPPWAGVRPVQVGPPDVSGQIADGLRAVVMRYENVGRSR